MRSLPHLTLVCLAVWMAPARAEEGRIFKYTQEDGTIVYTNAPKGRDRVAPSAIPREASPVAGAKNAAFQAKYEPFEETVRSCAEKYTLPAALLKAVMHAESAFESQALSPRGAMGLMQLMPGTARQLGVENPWEAEANIEGGARYLRMLSNAFDGNMVQVLAAYNAGPNAVKKQGGRIPPYAETQSYVRRVLSLYFVYQYQDTQRKEKER